MLVKDAYIQKIILSSKMHTHHWRYTNTMAGGSGGVGGGQEEGWGSEGKRKWVEAVLTKTSRNWSIWWSISCPWRTAWLCHRRGWVSWREPRSRGWGRGWSQSASLRPIPRAAGSCWQLLRSKEHFVLKDPLWWSKGKIGDSGVFRSVL